MLSLNVVAFQPVANEEGDDMKSRIITSLIAVLSGSMLVACGGGGANDGAPAAALKQLDQNASVALPDLSTSSSPGSNFNLSP